MKTIKDNGFIQILNDEKDNLIIKCNGYVVKENIDTPDGLDNTVFLSKSCKICQTDINSYFESFNINDVYCTGCFTDYVGMEKEILKISTKFIPLTLLFQMYADYNKLYSVKINSEMKKLNTIYADFS